MNRQTKSDFNHMVGLNQIMVLTLIIVKQSEGFTDILEKVRGKLEIQIQFRHFKKEAVQC